MNIKKSSQILRFCIGGGLGVSANFIALYVLTEFAGVWYVFSAMVGFFLNFGINFAVQKFWTFQNKNIELLSQQLVRYFAMSVGVLAGNTLLLFLLVEYGRLNYLLAQLILTVFFSIVSFVVTRKIFAT